jgi:sugar-specific transcriptional regulator TrmB
VTDGTWKKIESNIKQYAEVICKEYNKNEQVISFNSDKMQDILKCYKKYNKEIHLLMQHSYGDLNNFEKPNKELSDKIDRHKVAGAFLAAIIESEPLNVITKKPSANARTANELLSLFVGIHIIKAFANTQNINSGYKILFPNCCNNESYCKHFVKIVHRIKPLHKDVDTAVLFLMSHLFFLIEQYFLRNN